MQFVSVWLIYVRVTWFPSGHCLYFLWLFNHYVCQKRPRTLSCLRSQMTYWPAQTRLTGSVTSPPPPLPQRAEPARHGLLSSGMQTGPGVFLSSNSDLGRKAVFQTTLTNAVSQAMPSSSMHVYPYGRDQRNATPGPQGDWSSTIFSLP